MGDADAKPRLSALDALAASHATIFDAVDSLGDGGLERTLIPKLVVVGDQKSGKSSVLEAIARVPFPVDKKLCTRFPTELTLRRSDSHAVTVTIRPAKTDSTDALSDQLMRAFHRRLSIDDEAGLVASMREASTLILGGSSDSSLLRRFSDDTLRIEVCGPGRYPLTLVDLPGLFESETKEQSSQDKACVQRMVRSYISEPRNALLLVISAATPRANLLAPAEISRSNADRGGRRTLGIVSKVDKPDSVDDVLSLFQGVGEWTLRHGWHCLRNRTPEERRDGTDRDDAEAAYFKTHWREIHQDCKGIDLLRPRLARLLAEQIAKHLPALIVDVRREMMGVNARLAQLSVRRTTEMAQRNYLSQMAVRFEHLACDAVNGRYGSGMPPRLRAFFRRNRTADDDGDSDGGEDEHREQDKRLQAVTRAMTQIFHAVMALKGKSTEVEEPDESDFSLLGDGDAHEDDDSRAEEQDDDGVIKRQHVVPKEAKKKEEEEEEEKKIKDKDEEDKDGFQQEQRQRLFLKETRLRTQIKSAGRVLRPRVREQYEVFPLPILKRYDDFEEQVMDLAARFRGTESLHEVNTELLSELMRAETLRWRDIATSHLRLVWDAVMRFVDLALAHCVDADMLPDLRRLVIDDRLESLRVRVEARLNELLDCHDGVNPAFHDMFRAFDCMQGYASPQPSRGTISDKEIEEILQDTGDKTELARRISEHLRMASHRADMERMAVRRTIDTLKGYYHICLVSFSANVSALVIQNGLLNRVPYDIFTHDIVAQQHADTVAMIAGEKESDAIARVELERRGKTLKDALAVFEHYSRNMV